MSEYDDDQFDQPAGDEFDELLAAVRYGRGASRPNPEQFKQYAARIRELIYAVRQARNGRDAQLLFAREQQQRALSAQAAALLLHNALQEACEHIRRGTLPDQQQQRRWQQALAGSAAQVLLIQHNRAQAVAAVASMVLHELDNDGVQNSTHSLLAATLAAYQAGRQQ